MEYGVIIVLWGLCVTIFWMVVGWRAMRSHERIADAMDDQLRRRN